MCACVCVCVGGGGGVLYLLCAVHLKKYITVLFIMLVHYVSIFAFQKKKKKKKKKKKMKKDA